MFNKTWKEFDWKVKMRFFKTALVAPVFLKTISQTNVGGTVVRLGIILIFSGTAPKYRHSGKTPRKKWRKS